MTVVLDHVLDTVQHLLKKKVALERAVDPDTPDIIADGSRIVQVHFACILCPLKPISYCAGIENFFCDESTIKTKTASRGEQHDLLHWQNLIVPL